MQTEELIKYTEDPKKLNEYSLSELRAFIRKYPYFHTAYGLLLLNLKNIGDPRLEEFLAKYSVFVKDRHELFRKLIEIERVRDEQTSQSSEEEIPENPAAKEKNDIDELSDSQNAEHEGTDQTASDKTEPTRTTEDRKKKQYTREYLGSRISDTLSKQIDEAGKGKTKSKETDSDFFILDKTSKIKRKSEKELDTKEIDQTVNKKEEKNEESFELDESKKYKKSRNPDSRKGKAPYANQYFSEDYLKDIYYKKPEKKDDLIDQFIKYNPELEVKKPGDQENEDISEKSVREQDDVLTEKLANLYMKQGYYQKAIEAFEKLSLKYPKKSDYFAEQIERVKKIINEQ